MAYTKFEKIIIIGYGRVTGQVLEHVCDRKSDYGYSVEYIEHEPHPFSTLKKACQARGVPYFSIPEKWELGRRLEAVEEAQPPEELLDVPGMADELRRPMMLLVRCRRGGE